MIKIYPLRAFKDNYIWVGEISQLNKAFVVDPGESKPVLEHFIKNNINLTDILITHHHYDHTGGLKDLVNKFPNIKVYGADNSNVNEINVTVSEGNKVTVLDGNISFNVFNIPGHTLDHIAFYNKEMLFCGDTLFAAGCGRVFEGSCQQMLDSLLKLKSLPKDIKVYCAHEYTLANLEFAKTIEPNNKDIMNRIAKVKNLIAEGMPSLPVTLQEELDTNPFLRTNHVDVISAAKKHGIKDTTDTSVFTIIRQLKDNF